MAAGAVPALGADAKRRRLPIDLLATLLVEHSLVVRDISACRIDPLWARTTLARSAADLAAGGPGRLHTSYVRILRGGDRMYAHESEAQLTRRDFVLPLRLHEAALSLDLHEVCGGDGLDDAIAWEIAAASSGQFMCEWALRTLLAQIAPHLKLA